MLVKDVMASAVKAVTPETSLREVATLMCFDRFTALPVIEGDNKLLGVIAERDVLAHLFPSIGDIMGGMSTLDFESLESDYKKILPLKVADLMSRNVLTVEPDIPILEAVSIMARRNFRRIPVAHGDKLLGIISLGDIHRAIFMNSFCKG
jgi:CBS domain-containing protein